ncbi:MAG: hypothetical protein JWQ09_3018 [Segetibacter sp.]|nr:hypothetical protein [Segetibacter sp.]
MVITDKDGNIYNIDGKITISFPEYLRNEMVLNLTTQQIAMMIDVFMQEKSIDSGIVIYD